MWYYKTIVVELQGPRKQFDDIFIRFDTIYRRVTDGQPRDDSNSRAYA